MSRPDVVEGVLRDMFDDVALLIGGAAVLHGLPDGTVRGLLRRLTRLRAAALSRLSCGGAGPRPTHPAVEAFLQRPRRARPETREEATACPP